MGPQIDGNIVEVVLTIIAMSFWVLFPIGMFISVSHVDKNTDQVVRLDHLRHDSVEETSIERPIPRRDKTPIYANDHFDWHHPILHFKRWLHH